MNDNELLELFRSGVEEFTEVSDEQIEESLARLFAEAEKHRGDGAELDDDELEMLAAAGVPYITPEE